MLQEGSLGTVPLQLALRGAVASPQKQTYLWPYIPVGNECSMERSSFSLTSEEML